MLKTEARVALTGGLILAVHAPCAGQAKGD
jgi:hypothetical protein